MELSPNQIASWNLRRLRRSAAMTQQRLAELMNHYGLTWTAFTVSDAERAVDQPDKGRKFSPDELALLALVLGVTPTELLVPPSPIDCSPEGDNVDVMVRIGELTMTRETYLTDVLLRPSGIAAHNATGELVERPPAT